MAALREICDLLRKIAPWGAACFMAWCLVLVARAFAGQLTIAQIDVLVKVFVRVSSPVYPWTLAIIAMGYGYLQRQERRRKTEYLQRRIIELEIKIDPTRTSSLLEADGSTREEDRL